MAEPASTSSTVFASMLITALGTVAGEYTTIILAALLGCFWTLSGASVGSRVKGAFFVVRMVSTAVIFTGSVAWLISHYTNWPAHHLLAGVAFLIAYYGDRWRRLLGAIATAAILRVGGNPRDQKS